MPSNKTYNLQSYDYEILKLSLYWQQGGFALRSNFSQSLDKRSSEALLYLYRHGPFPNIVPLWEVYTLVRSICIQSDIRNFLVFRSWESIYRWNNFLPRALDVHILQHNQLHHCLDPVDGPKDVAERFITSVLYLDRC